MKWYGIIAFVILIGGLGGIVYLGSNTEKIGLNFESIKIFEYDCAKAWDEYRDIYYTKWDPTAHINDGTNYPVRLKMAQIEDIMLENACFEKIEEWAYKSKYEKEIWENYNP